MIEELPMICQGVCQDMSGCVSGYVDRVCDGYVDRVCVRECQSV